MRREEKEVAFQNNRQTTCFYLVCGSSECCLPYHLFCLQTVLFKLYCLPRLQIIGV